MVGSLSKLYSYCKSESCRRIKHIRILQLVVDSCKHVLLVIKPAHKTLQYWLFTGFTLVRWLMLRSRHCCRQTVFCPTTPLPWSSSPARRYQRLCTWYAGSLTLRPSRKSTQPKLEKLISPTKDSPIWHPPHHPNSTVDTFNGMQFKTTRRECWNAREMVGRQYEGWY